MYEIWVDRLACVVHEDDVLEMVGTDAYHVLEDGESLDFKLVELDKHKDLLNAAKIAAEWMRWWLNNRECECENGHSCGKNEREAELEELEKVIAMVEVE